MTAKKEKAPSREEQLVEELSKHYGVEMKGDAQDDMDDFIKECNEAAKKKAKGDQGNHQVLEAMYEDKIAQLRMMKMDDSQKGENQQQKDLRKALKDADLEAVGLSFPDDKTWHLNAGGKEDSGHMTVPTDVVVERANRMVNPDQLS